VLKCLQSGDITSKACQKVLSDPEKLARLITQCQKHKNTGNPVCQVINTIPSLPTGGTGLPTLTLPTSIIPTILAMPGARRVAFGPRGPTMRQLSRMYDPGLVSLLVPGLVVTR